MREWCGEDAVSLSARSTVRVDLIEQRQGRSNQIEFDQGTFDCRRFFIRVRSETRRRCADVFLQSALGVVTWAGQA